MLACLPSFPTNVVFVMIRTIFGRLDSPGLNELVCLGIVNCIFEKTTIKSRFYVPYFKNNHNVVCKKNPLNHLLLFS